MRTQAIPRSYRRILTGAVMGSFFWAAGPKCGAAEAPTPKEWLKLDDNGEPCEATLADGTVLTLDTYGDEYEATESRPPVNAAEKGQTVLDYQKAGLMRGVICIYLRLDVAGRQMYWIESGPSNICNIRSAPLSGRSTKLLVELQYQAARGLAIDHNRHTLYWGNHAATLVAYKKPPSARKAIWKAGLDGKNPEPLFSGLTMPGAIAVEPATGDIFYFDDLRLVRGAADGKKESLVIESLTLPYSGYARAYRAFDAAIDSTHKTVYWLANSSWFARANLDGTGFQIPFDGGDTIGAAAVDPEEEKIYWIDTKSQELWRANLDGSQPEVIAIGLAFGTSLDVDDQQRYLYWTDSRRIGNSTCALIRKLKLPATLATSSKPAPPLITAIEPAEASSGEKILLRGQHLSGANRVKLIGDDGRQSDGKIIGGSDTELAFVLPPRRDGVRREAIVVQGPGGVTVTLPRETKVIKRNDRKMTTFDRFQDGDTFCFIVEPETAFVHVEQSLVYVPGNARAFAGGRGNTVLFLKNGAGTSGISAEDVVIYHEPFAKILGRSRGKGQQEYLPVPAIRPSFVEALFQYQEKE